MDDPVLERIRQQLDLETRSPSLLPIPNGFYSKLATYCQRLRRSAGSGSSDVTLRLVDVQTKLIERMSRDLITLRTDKAKTEGPLQLLPEERYVSSVAQEYHVRLEAFVDALCTGQPSFIQYANRRESGRSVVVRFTKRVDELIGLDLRRYGPFETDDVASIPAANADILVAGGDAVEIRAKERV